MRRYLYILFVIFLTILSITAQDETATNAQVVAMNSRLIVRHEPFLDSVAVGYLESGTPITVTGRSADFLWLATTAHNGVDGWVNADFVTITTDITTLPVTHSRNLIGVNTDFSSEVQTHEYASSG
jgi:uncharacterized protein YgiM (DUF1202 family)